MRCILFMILLTLLGAIYISIPVYAQNNRGTRPQPLFEQVKVDIPPSSPALQFARGYQPVRIHWEQVYSLQPKSRVLLNLMPGLQLVGVVDRMEIRSENRFSCFGHIEGEEGTSFILVLEEDALALFVNLPPYEATFDLRYVGNDLYAVIWVGEEPPCGTHENMTPEPFEMTPEDAEWHEHFSGHDFDPAGDDFGTAACVQPQAVLDVAVYYTTQARQAIGGVNQMHARIQLFIDQCNEAYQNSQIALRARLVRRLEVAYADEGGGDSRTQLDHLTNPSDGVLDGIHPDRTNYRADQVILLVNNMVNACGRAWCGNGSDPDRAFGVVQWNCTTYTFPHEIGHNQGCGHDRDNGGCGFRSYGFGWRFFGNNGVQYRTVMAYAPGTRIPYFSNPNVNFQGVATGVPIGQPNEAHNAQVIGETRRSRENFRLLDIWVDFGYTGTQLGSFTQPYRTLTSGANAITTFVDTALVEFPTLRIKVGSTGGSYTISKRMRIEACGGLVRIGAP